MITTSKATKLNVVLTKDEMVVVLAALSSSIDRSGPPKTQEQAALVLSLFTARDKILAACGTTLAELEAATGPATPASPEASDD